MNLRKLETSQSTTLNILNIALISDGYLLRTRCGYKMDTRVTKITNTTEEDCQELYPCWNIGFLNAIFSMNFE